MEIHCENNIKTIAFYLPQFHCIPENDEAHGKGFTEWTNTKKAKPLFEGHYQPRTPLNNNYYCLDDINVMYTQAAMARKYGISGFCFYHYWFRGGKKLLEKPVEAFLQHKDIDMPFCLSWANENWSKRWDGGNGEIIAKQEYGSTNEWKAHVDYLVEFFRDSRYIRIDDKPVFIIYRPDLIPNIKKMVSFYKNEVIKRGFKGLVVMAQHPTYFVEGENREIFDYYIEFEPAFINKIDGYRKSDYIKRKIERILLNTFGDDFVTAVKKNITSKKKDKLTKCNYDESWNKILDLEVESEKQIAGAFVDWDNTSRNINGLMYTGTTPIKFEKYFSALCKKVKTDYGEKIIFINAWNEWAEGAYLEPDERYGFRYLEAVKRVLDLEGEI